MSGAGRVSGRGRGPGRPAATAARTPFVVLIVTLLAGGLFSLLLLNSAVNRDSFELNRLQKETTDYTDQEQALQQEVDQFGAPGSLERRARELGMVPGGNPAFLAPDGTVRGSPDPATAAPSPATTDPSPAAAAPPPATVAPPAASSVPPATTARPPVAAGPSPAAATTTPQQVTP